MNYIEALGVALLALNLILGLLLLIGKLRIVVVYQENEEIAPWPGSGEGEEVKEQSTSTTKSLDKPKPPTLVHKGAVSPRKRGRPRKAVMQQFPAPPLL